jgi:hypothetical protein
MSEVRKFDGSGSGSGSGDEGAFASWALAAFCKFATVYNAILGLNEGEALLLKAMLTHAFEFTPDAASGLNPTVKTLAVDGECALLLFNFPELEKSSLAVVRSPDEQVIVDFSLGCAGATRREMEELEFYFPFSSEENI